MPFAWQMLYIPAVLVLLVLTGIMMFRAVRGPRTTDRIVAINMISTMVVCIILIFSQLLSEDWLLDVALIYAMISLVTVTMLASLYVKPARGGSGPDRSLQDGSGPAGGSEEAEGGKEK